MLRTRSIRELSREVSLFFGREEVIVDGKSRPDNGELSGRHWRDI
jgi:hypothetical protein